MKVLAWDEHQKYQDVSRERKRVITREEDPDLFTTLAGSTRKLHAIKGSFVLTPKGPDAIEIENQNQAYGNSTLTIEASGWELAAMLNAMVPMNKLQKSLRDQLSRAVGFELAGGYNSLMLEHAEYTRVVHFKKNKKKKMKK